MVLREETPLAGVFRVMYFLATGVALVIVIVSAITAFYDPPEGTVENDVDFPFEDGFVQAAEEREDYNRNVSMILQITSAGVFATAMLGLGSRFNPLRAGLMLGGLGIYLVGVGFWASSSDQWIGFVTALVNFAVLGAGFLWLEEGLPLSGSGVVRRIEIPASAEAVSPATPPTVPPPPPPPVAPPPREMPPEAPAVPPPDQEPPVRPDS